MSKLFPTHRTALAAALLLAPLLTQAAAPSVTATIAGTGGFCDVSPLDPSAPPANCRSGYALTGTVTLTLVGAPDGTGTQFGSDGGPVIEAYGSNWVTSTLQLQWTHATQPPGSFDVAFSTSGEFGGGTSAVVFDNYPFITDAPPLDKLELSGTANTLIAQTDTYIEGTLASFTLVRTTADTNWLQGVGFDLQKGLAPSGGNPSFTENLLTFTFARVFGNPNDPASVGIGPDTYAATFQLTSMTVSAVPEPGSWALFGAGGLALLGLARRRRADLG